MRQRFLKAVLTSVFVLSIGTAGAVATEPALVVARPLAPCPPCNLVQLNCPESPCTCSYNTTVGQYQCHNTQ